MLEAIGAASHPHSGTLFYPAGNCGRAAVSDFFKSVTAPIPLSMREERFYRWWYDRYLPFAIWRRGVDLFHGPSYLLPLTSRARTVVTVHDLTHEKFPMWSPGCSRSFSLRARESASRADAVVAVSITTKRDICELFHLPEERIRVIYEGVDHRFRPVKDAVPTGEFRARHRLPDNFILAVSSLHPRKNLSGLLRAYAACRKRRGFAQALVVAGKNYGLNLFSDEAAGLGISGDALFLDYVSYDDLPVLYSLADLFIFPSFYEGFGLPPLEAMACGTPVLASRAGALPEVLGDAAAYFDPANIGEMAEMLSAVASSPAEMDRLRVKGFLRAARYTWEKCARETLELYNDLV